MPTYPEGVQTLVREPSNAASASSVGDDRVVYAFAGGARTTTFVEAPDAGALTYALQPTASSGASAEWNGMPLGACDAAVDAPCAQVTQDVVTAHVVGSGTLATNGTKLTASGGASTRKITWVVRLR